MNTVYQKDSRGNNRPDSPCKSYQEKPGGMHIWESEEKHEGESSSEAPSVSAKFGYQNGRGGRLAPGEQGAPKTAMHVFYLGHFLFVLTLLPREPDWGVLSLLGLRVAKHEPTSEAEIVEIMLYY